MSRGADYVSSYRRRVKEKLVAYHGGACLDCGLVGAPFVFDFDHREPTEKIFAIGNLGKNIAYEKMLAESLKCDLVCANCHRVRTHKQRCPGCQYC